MTNQERRGSGLVTQREIKSYEKWLKGQEVLVPGETSKRDTIADFKCMKDREEELGMHFPRPTRVRPGPAERSDEAYIWTRPQEKLATNQGCRPRGRAQPVPGRIQEEAELRRKQKQQSPWPRLTLPPQNTERTEEEGIFLTEQKMVTDRRGWLLPCLLLHPATLGSFSATFAPLCPTPSPAQRMAGHQDTASPSCLLSSLPSAPGAGWVPLYPGSLSTPMLVASEYFPPLQLWLIYLSNSPAACRRGEGRQHGQFARYCTQSTWHRAWHTAGTKLTTLSTRMYERTGF